MCNCTSSFDAEPVIGPAKGRTRWHRPGMTDNPLRPRLAGVGPPHQKAPFDQGDGNVDDDDEGG